MLTMGSGQGGGEYVEQTVTQAAITKEDYQTLKAHADKEWVNKVVTAMFATKINGSKPITTTGRASLPFYEEGTRKFVPRC
jgi:hypothetical protein